MLNYSGRKTNCIDFSIEWLSVCLEDKIRLAYSFFFLLAGRIGTNLNFCAPCRVISGCFLAKLLIALEGGILELDADGPSRKIYPPDRGIL
jgi:hypothetical protein